MSMVLIDGGVVKKLVELSAGAWRKKGISKVELYIVIGMIVEQCGI